MEDLNCTGKARADTARDHFLGVYRVLAAPAGAVVAIHGAIPTPAHPQPLPLAHATSQRARGPRVPRRPHGFANIGSKTWVTLVHLSHDLQQGHSKQGEDYGCGEHLHTTLTD